MTHHYTTHSNPKLSYHAFESKKASFKVFPHMGGSLLDWVYEGNQILAPFPISETGIGYYNTFYPSSLLFPFPNRLDGGKFSHDGMDYELPINDETLGNAIHGCISKNEFEVLSVSDESIHLKYNHSGDVHFPFKFKVIVSYHFSDSGIHVHVEVENLDEKSFPFGVGWHPYFHLEDATKSSISLDSDKTFITNDRMIPLQSETVYRKKILLKGAQLDTGFALTESDITLTTPHYTLNLKTPGFDFLQLFIPEDRKSIAIEPMTCIANSFNNGIGKLVLKPTESRSFNLHLSVNS